MRAGDAWIPINGDVRARTTTDAHACRLVVEHVDHLMTLRVVVEEVRPARSAAIRSISSENEECIC
jgi:hypothetical protein